MVKGLKLSIFENELFGEVRFTYIDGKLYAIGLDVAKALGYSNGSKAVSTHCKKAIKEIVDVSSQNGRSHKSRNTQEMFLIPQSDIYRLIIKSRLPQAEQFESWVFDTVLPTLESDGMYIKDEENMKSEEELLKIAEEKLERKMMRKFGKGIRRDFTDTIKKNWEIKNNMQFATYTDQLVNIPILGARASEYKKDNGLPRKALIRDYLDINCLDKITKQEQDVATLIDFGLDYTKVKELVKNKLKN